MFSDKDLKNLIFPLFVEQFLLMFVGIADTFVVSFSSEADVSGVSLVTSFNTVLIFLFTALSSGGAVIISQYIGNQNKKAASEAASQLLLVSVLISVFMSALILIFRQPLLKLLFGKIEPDVMNACEIYLVITTLSLPALAVYDAGAALCRSIGKTEVTMYISTITNVINVIGNCIGVFVLHLDAANHYFKKLNRITLVLSVLWNAFVFVITPLIVRYSAISAEAKSLVIWLVLINNIFNGLAYPFAGSLGNGLRAAGDVKFTMIVSVTLTIAARLLFSALFGLWRGWGVIGVAIGMSVDLVFRGAIFIWRYKSQKWTQFQLI